MLISRSCTSEIAREQFDSGYDSVFQALPAKIFRVRCGDVIIILSMELLFAGLFFELGL
jgi:hypothetical protein